MLLLTSQFILLLPQSTSWIMISEPIPDASIQAQANDTTSIALDWWTCWFEIISSLFLSPHFGLSITLVEVPKRVAHPCMSLFFSSNITARKYWFCCSNSFINALLLPWLVMCLVNLHKLEKMPCGLKSCFPLVITQSLAKPSSVPLRPIYCRKIMDIHSRGRIIPLVWAYLYS